jgi:ferrous iron transport protein B
MAAREVVVSSLATVYALSSSGVDAADALIPLISSGWSLATALSLLAWFVFAPQCLSTIAAVKRETGGWKIPVIMLSYLFGLAYLASFITYHLAIFLGLG